MMRVTSLLYFGLLLPVLAQETSEPWLKGIRQLTFTGKRAGEGYFSADGRKLIFQSERDAANPFFQMYVLDLESGDTSRVSPGQGKTTCGWIFPDGKSVMFASTHADADAAAKQAAEIKDRAEGKQKRYSWDYDENYDLWRANLDGSGLVNLTHTLGYDAEGAISADGQWIVFSSNRHGYTDNLSAGEKEHFTEAAIVADGYLHHAHGWHGGEAPNGRARL